MNFSEHKKRLLLSLLDNWAAFDLCVDLPLWKTTSIFLCAFTVDLWYSLARFIVSFPYFMVLPGPCTAPIGPYGFVILDSTHLKFTVGLLWAFPVAGLQATMHLHGAGWQEPSGKTEQWSSTSSPQVVELQWRPGFIIHCEWTQWKTLTVRRKYCLKAPWLSK